MMVDGSHLTLRENILYTKSISSLAHAKGLLVEAELGRLSGSEDGLTVEEYEARFTDVAQERSSTTMVIEWPSTVILLPISKDFYAFMVHIYRLRDLLMRQALML